jgi:hypothetical protein
MVHQEAACAGSADSLLQVEQESMRLSCVIAGPEKNQASQIRQSSLLLFELAICIRNTFETIIHGTHKGATL